MCTIKVSSIMKGKDYPTAGDSLYQRMVFCLDSEDRVILDMNGVLLIPSMFLNVSIGRLAQERGVEYVKKYVSFSHIKVSDAQRIQQYFKRLSNNLC